MISSQKKPEDLRYSLRFNVYVCLQVFAFGVSIAFAVSIHLAFSKNYNNPLTRPSSFVSRSDISRYRRKGTMSPEASSWR
ncbi:hypothetical protein K504DRAFT_156598 [Pleomassaria siparia CBS 279.74]|uniref:Uncharacterized protein n=1 Tax=Pleomassaria siparia CBS 279.74 TaxID=1314801 RepID=A0A6G1KMZ2_9PLEO|nr:hypothetical protein K504DRAFT_156598 [Pleomassaria siparia CBS 279.74]